jgi:hypothetical protein
VVLDNLREGVLSPDFYDAGVNPLYCDVLGHYGVTALTCKVRDSPHSPDCNLAANHTYAGTCLLQWLTTSKNPCLRAIKSFPLPLLWDTQLASRNGCREHRTRLPQERVNGKWGIGGNDNRVRGQAANISAASAYLRTPSSHLLEASARGRISNICHADQFNIFY